MNTLFVKVSPTGRLLRSDAQDWELVLDTRTDLLWTRGFAAEEPLPWKQAVAASESFLTGAGMTWFRAPTIAERLRIVDYSRCAPAIDINFFDSPGAGWEWTATPVAASPAVCAWIVSFANGDSRWCNQAYGGFVRACRPRQCVGPLVPGADQAEGRA